MSNSRMNAGNPRNYSFADVPANYCPRTRLYRPSTLKTSMNTDYLYPIYLDEVLPGDTHKVDVGALCRMTTSLCPFMDNLYLDVQFFFVPNRLTWEHWQAFCGEEETPGDTTSYTIPVLSYPTGGYNFNTIFDYFGIPPKVELSEVNALPFRAYNLVWNEWYRDENLQARETVQKGDGPDTYSIYHMLKRGKRKDYFTSCLPWPQKGAGVTVPLGSINSFFPTTGDGHALGIGNGDVVAGFGVYSSTYDGQAFHWGTGIAQMETSTTTPSASSFGSRPDGVYGVTQNPAKSGLHTKVQADLGSVSINTLRQAFQMQKFAERMARGGTRYVEILKSMFGVVSPDARLQRPELLTSFTIPLQLYINQQTSASESGATPQGNLTANGTFSGVHYAFHHSFVEHGYILGLASIRSDLSYQQGLHRMWSRRTKYDFYWPTFAHLGEQAVLNQEIYAQGSAEDKQVFGYQERWSEYKYGQNKICGTLRSDHPQSLDIWHLAQDFSSLPTLNSSFVSEQVPLARSLALSPTEGRPAFVCDFSFNVVSARPMPLYDVPGLVDHF